MTSDELAFIRAICADPADDTVRLVYADWLEEHGGRPQRAEFIRLQVEVARVEKWPGWTPTAEEITAYGKKLGGIEQLQALWRLNNCDRELKLEKLRKRERAILRGDAWIPWDDLTAFCRAMGFAHHGSTFGVYPRMASEPDLPTRVEWKWHRGFLTELTATAADFVRHADALCWHPTQQRDCPYCLDYDPATGRPAGCRKCNGTGRDPRPCPPTAQPITKVTLTTFPEVEADPHLSDIVLTGDPKREHIPARDVPTVHPPDTLLHLLLRHRFGSHVEYVLPRYTTGHMPAYHTVSRLVAFNLTAEQVARLTPDQVGALLRQVEPAPPPA